MIYNESTKSFIKLETALKELGFDQQTIDLAIEYLDITKPRNIFSVLVGIIDLNDNILWFWIF